jgi:hypothetical protein
MSNFAAMVVLPMTAVVLCMQVACVDSDRFESNRKAGEEKSYGIAYLEHFNQAAATAARLAESQAYRDTRLELISHGQFRRNGSFLGIVIIASAALGFGLQCLLVLTLRRVGILHTALLAICLCGIGCQSDAERAYGVGVAQGGPRGAADGDRDGNAYGQLRGTEAGRKRAISDAVDGWFFPVYAPYGVRAFLCGFVLGPIVQKRPRLRLRSRAQRFQAGADWRRC